jgi:single-strand DNA-binding protein
MAIGDITLTAVGNLTGDVELRFTSSGQAVAEFTIAVNPRERDAATGNYRDGDPSFVSVQVWRQLAENCAESLTKGTRVIATGRWREERWEDKEGQKRSRWRLTADSVGPDLTFATAKLNRTTRRAETPPGDPWATGSPNRPADQSPQGDPPF